MRPQTPTRTPTHTHTGDDHAAYLAAIQNADTADRDLQQNTAEPLAEIYLYDGDRRAHDLQVELTDIEQIQFEL
ncbi:hypothetical protein ACIQD1_31260 [Streptomyces sp. NPDC093088]|uniref:hypothetical protein n=1 Tax=Streptomyces sp. NPDC093088 TaxID=3366023 RepID=UPI0037F7C3AF